MSSLENYTTRASENDVTITNDVAETNSKSQSRSGLEALNNLHIPNSNSEEEEVMLRRTSVNTYEGPADFKRAHSFKTIANVVKLGRRYSSINEADLQKALRALKTPTTVPDCIWESHMTRLNSLKENPVCGEEESLRKPSLNANEGSADNFKRTHSLRRIANVTKRERRYSSINQSDIQEALRTLKTPTTVPDCIWESHMTRLNSLNEDPVCGEEESLRKTSLNTNEGSDDNFRRTHSLRRISNVTKRERRYSSINQGDIQEALRTLKT